MKLLYLMIILMAGCTKDPMPAPCTMPPCDSTTAKKDSLLKLIWQTPLRLDNDYTPGNQILLSSENELVAFLYDYTGNEKVLFVNKKDSSTTRFLPEEGGIMNSFYHPIAGFIIMTSKSVFTRLDASSMKKIASAPNGLQFFANYNLIGDFVYGDLRDEGQRISYLFRLNVITGEIFIVQTIPDSNFPEYDEVTLTVPTYFIAGENDTLMRYGALFWKDNWVTKSTVEVYNKKSGLLLWNDENKKLNVSQRRTIMFGNRLISCNVDSIYCLDPHTGKTIWSIPPIRSTIPIGWSLGNVIIHDGKLCFLNEGHFVEINANTGQIIYDSPEIFSPQSNSGMTYFEGILYWTCVEKGYSQIFGFRVSDHKLVLKMKSPNAGKPPYYNDTNFVNNGLKIDPETRLAYTADGFFGYCFRIPVSYP